ncbi:hypothetical protein QYE76_023723 [Lolium multiflorum]|uniref:GRF-type domain-containing protein n=1 Tax=Lolium multiflorum TaxID=4521 RepID=A0AAD8RCP8_LOLMU|nr:hypothetical protein QYE76_023723 [Lolium multiflorum]
MASSDPTENPRKWKHTADLWPSNFPEGTEQARCWCGDLCVSKRCDDWDAKHGRRFWMCPNYAHDKAKPRNPYDYPPSPPPLCQFVKWIDLEQSTSHKEEMLHMWFSIVKVRGVSLFAWIKTENRVAPHVLELHFAQHSAARTGATLFSD